MGTGDVKIEVYVPEAYVLAVRDAMSGAGAGRTGRYDLCCAWHPVTGSWRPLAGANPYDGKEGEVRVAAEYKLEMRCAAALVRNAVLAARGAHPYEEPLINVIPLWDERLS